MNTLKYAHRACEIRGMSGGVRENVTEVAPPPFVADRLGPVMDATRGLQKAVARLAVPPPMPPPLPQRVQAGGQDNVQAIELADAVMRTCKKVVGSIRERVRVEQTTMELQDQNEQNEVDLSKLELDVMLGAGAPAEAQRHQVSAAVGTSAPAVGAEAQLRGSPVEQHLRLLKRHGALQAASRRNNEQRKRMELRSVRSQQAKSSAEKKNEAELLSLLTRSRKVIEGDGNEGGVSELERRLLQSQQSLALLEIERIEAEQSRVCLEAAARRHEVALRKQKLQLDVHAKALAVAEALLQQQGLMEQWHHALGPLAKLLPQQAHEAPSLDELIAEVSAPATPAKGSRPSSSAAGAADPQEQQFSQSKEDEDVAADFREIEEGFMDMRATLNQSLRKYVREESTEADDEEVLDYEPTEDYIDEDDTGDP